MNLRRFAFALLLSTLFLPVCARAQRGGGNANGTVVVHVQNSDGSPFDGQADVSLSLSSVALGTNQYTGSGAKAEFHNLLSGEYYVQVTAQGYKSGTDRAEVSGTGGETQVWIKMEPDNSDPNSKPVTRGTIRSPKAQKNVDKGIAALKAGNFDEAQKGFQAAYTLAPGDPDVNYLLGYTFLLLKDFAQADVYLTRATSLDTNNISALLAIAQLRTQQNNYSGAVMSLQQAASLDPNNYMAHWSLASAYLHTSQFEKARAEAATAVKTGKGAANGAEIIIGEALAALGQNDQAIEALQAFVRDAPDNSAVPAAKQMIEKLQSGKTQQSQNP